MAGSLHSQSEEPRAGYQHDQPCWGSCELQVPANLFTVVIERPLIWGHIGLPVDHDLGVSVLSDSNRVRRARNRLFNLFNCT